MAEWFGFWGIEDLGLTDGQRATLIAGIRAMGLRDSDGQPAWRMHDRVRPDGLAMIAAGTFEDDQLTVAALKQRMATLFGVNVSTITSTTSTQSYAGGTTTVVTLKYNTVNKLRVALFGGVGADWEQSRAETCGYLAANAADWGDLA